MIESFFTKSPQSYWIDSVNIKSYSPLYKDIKVDVAVIGGGMAGISTAYTIKNEGLKVAVLDAGKILNGTTGHTTAKITSQHSLIYDKIKKKMGEEKASIYAKANETAISTIANIVKEKNIDCDFSWQPAYVYTQDEKNIQKIIDEVETAQKCGIQASFVENIPLPFKINAAIKFEKQAQFHPLKYLKVLTEEITQDGSDIFENTKVIGIIEESGSCVLITNTDYKVYASKVVICSHYPCYDGLGLYFTRIYPDRSYIIGARIEEKFPDGMYINTDQPTRSLRSQETNGEQMVLFVGENHKTGQGEDTSSHYKNLIDFARETFTTRDILYRWSTQDYTTMDEVPYIGKLTGGSSNIFVATGFSKWGMTNSVVASIIIKDLIIKGENPWAQVYDPTRFTPIASAKNFVRENIDVASHLISGKLEHIPNDIVISVGEGKVIEINGNRIGAFKDELEILHLVDTTCTHLGCELQWNSAERSWDCPCHGSRFDFDGEVLDGPAILPLKKYGEHKSADPEVIQEG
jgi:glycine/D-amino acid oxidase-like deaminating enzyme/nitrite reductase/ring-hydroxylating ferredoxin subunit